MPFNPVPAPLAEQPINGLRATLKPKVQSGRWTQGITYLPEGCVEGDAKDICDPSAITSLELPDIVRWYPVDLTISKTCTAIAADIEETRAEVTRMLESDTERQIGDELWNGRLARTGTLPGGAAYPNTWLADIANIDILTEQGPVGLTHGLACLEEYLNRTNSGQRGMIHATAQVVTHWSSFGLLEREGDTLRTRLGTLVIASPGYNGANPDQTVGTDNIWAYASDAVRIFLGQINTTAFDTTAGGIVDRSDNTMRVVARRPALAEWPRCRHAGARLAMTACGISGS